MQSLLAQFFERDLGHDPVPVSRWSNKSKLYFNHDKGCFILLDHFFNWIANVSNQFMFRVIKLGHHP